MIDYLKAIDEKYCKDNLVQLMTCTDCCQLIMDNDEILFLKTGNNILINKYINHPRRYSFPYSDNEKHYEDCYLKYNQLFEYNKEYLDFKGSFSGFNIRKMSFFKGSERALYTTTYLNSDDRNLVGEVAILPREVIERIFDGNEYDSMYVIDRNGDILYAKSKKDGHLIDRKLIPTEEEIIKSEYEDRISKRKIAKKSTGNFKDNDLESIKPKTIEEINDYNIYGPCEISSNKYNHFLITSRNGKFEIKYFKLDYVGYDNFKLTCNNILIPEITIDDVINYSKNNEIRYTREPVIIETDESIKKAISKISSDDLPQISLDFDKKTDEESTTEEKGFSKILKRILKNN